MNKSYLLLSFLFLLSLQGQAQNTKDSLPAEKKEVKIGLVLSGGGAKGMAHIGVLKVLEKYKIKPDYIAGTSMGAIVGSLYAAGYSADQIDSIFRKIDFDKVLFDFQERKYKSFYKKKTGPKYIFSLPFSFKEMSVQIPKGLSSSQNMFNEMSHYLYPVHPIENFNHLKIPFLCISTDISTGEQVLFNKGFLPEAVTASALLPTVYAPLEIDNRLLLDGGIVNNYPVKEVRDLGADFIIGSDVQGKILKKEEIKDITKIMDQIVSFQMYKEMPKKKLQTDLYLHPDINGIGITDFDKLDTIIQRGINVAEKKIPEFAKKYKSKNYKQNRLNFKYPDSLYFDEIIIKGQRNHRRNYILNKIGVHTKRKISYQDFLEGINNLYGTENFDFIHYRFNKKGSHRILQLKIKEKDHNAYVNIGFHYNPLYKINVIGNLEKKYLFAKNDFFSFDIIGGENTRFNLDYFIDNGFGWNIGWHSGYHRVHSTIDSKNFFDSDISLNQLDLNIKQWTDKLSFQGSLKHSVYFSLGLIHQYKDYYTLVFSGADQDVPYTFNKNHYFGSFVQFYIDSRDNFDFPKKGILLSLNWNYFPFSSNYFDDFNPFSIYKAQLEFSKKLFNNFYLQTKIHSGLSYSKKSTFDNYFYIGGNSRDPNFDNFEDLPFLDPLSINATKFFRSTVVFDYIFAKKHHLEIGGHYLTYDNTDYLWGENKQNISGISISYGYESFLGPVKLTFSRSPDTDKHNVSFTFGYIF